MGSLSDELDKLIEQKAIELFSEKLVQILAVLSEEIGELKGLVTDTVQMLEDME